MMQLRAIGFCLLLGACSGAWETTFDAPVSTGLAQGWHLHDVVVDVPPDLTTTEDNIFAPEADIVWHGDPWGDRKAQVAAILHDAVAQAAAPLSGRRGVDFFVTVREFHALTPRARSSAPSAVHNLAFDISVLDDRTGEVVVPSTFIRADLLALTGVAAIEAVVQGDTQKVRISRHLTEVVAGWLGIAPDPRRTFRSLGR